MGEKILENERMQVMCPAGRFGRSLLAAECNQQMFELLGEYIYSSLYKMMPQEDMAARQVYTSGGSGITLPTAARIVM